MKTLFALLIASIIHGEGPGNIVIFENKAACERAAVEVVAFYGGNLDPNKASFIKWKCVEMKSFVDTNEWVEEQKSLWNGKTLPEYKDYKPEIKEEKPDPKKNKTETKQEQKKNSK